MYYSQLSFPLTATKSTVSTKLIGLSTTRKSSSVRRNENITIKLNYSFSVKRQFYAALPQLLSLPFRPVFLLLRGRQRRDTTKRDLFLVPRGFCLDFFSSTYAKVVRPSVLKVCPRTEPRRNGRKTNRDRHKKLSKERKSTMPRRRCESNLRSRSNMASV